jgi:nitrate/nitrite transport system substrate-binding protein
MRADWVDANPVATKAIMMAVMEAQMWCEDMANKEELAEIVGRRQWFNVPPADILGRLKGDVNYGNGRMATATGLQMKFWRDGGASSYPWKSLDTWFLTENIRWGYQPASLDVASVVTNTNRADLWLDAARELGVDVSGFGDSRGPETMFDGKVFDPANPSAYLDSLAIKAMV